MGEEIKKAHVTFFQDLNRKSVFNCSDKYILVQLGMVESFVPRLSQELLAFVSDN